MSRLIDLTGQRFGRLAVIARADNKGTLTYWKCVCECGTERVVCGGNLRRRFTTSCGCLRNELAATRRVDAPNGITHGDCRGFAKSSEYACWDGMKQRCNNPNNARYADYGGRGITVCERWNDSYEAFLEDMGRKPSTHLSIDRIDNDGNYEPSNCRWATKSEQNENRRGYKWHE